MPKPWEKFSTEEKNVPKKPWESFSQKGAEAQAEPAKEMSLGDKALDVLGSAYKAIQVDVPKSQAAKDIESLHAKYITESNPNISPEDALKEAEYRSSLASAAGTVSPNLNLTRTEGILGKLGGKLKTAAEGPAVGALGINKRTAEKLFTKGDLNSLGRTVLDEGVITNIPSSHGKMINKVDDLLAKYGDEYGEVIKQMDDAITNGEAKGISRADISNNLRARFLSKSDNPTAQANNRVINKFIDTFEKLNPDGTASGPDKIYTIAEAQAEKQTAQEIAKSLYNKIPGMPVTNKEVANAALASEFKNSIENVLQNTSPSGSKISQQEFIALKDKYGALKTAQEILTKKEAGNIANRMISPSDYLAGSTGAISSSVLQQEGSIVNPSLSGIAAALINKYGRTYGSQILANLLNKSGTALQSAAPLPTADLIGRQLGSNLNALQRRKQQLEGAQ